MLYNRSDRYCIDENYLWRIIDAAPQVERDFQQPNGYHDINALSQKLDALWIQRNEIYNEIKEIKELLAYRMVEEGISLLQTSNLDIHQKTDYVINIERCDSIHVYELLEDNGYNCTTYSSQERKKSILQILDENGVLPDWLNDFVDVSEQEVIDIRIRQNRT